MRDLSANLTPLGVMVLALLREGDMHPYEMMRLMRQRQAERLVALTNGTFYHTVARLERLDLLEEVGVDRDGARPERTTYTLTGAGRDAVEHWVRAELTRVDHPAQFRIALAEAHNLSRDETIELLRVRAASLADERERHTDALTHARARDVPEQFLLEIGRQETLLAAELDWLHALLARLEQRDFAWGEAELGPRSAHYLSDRMAAQR